MARNDHIKSQTELDRDAASEARKNEERLAKQFEIKDGKFLGLIPIPAELQRTFGLIIGPLTTALASGFGNFAAGATEKILKTKMFEGSVKDPKFASDVAKTAGTGLVIFSRLALEGYGFTRDRATNYLNITRETKEIADEVGAAADNKMIALAFRKYHQSWGEDIKKLIPAVVQAVSMLPYAQQEYKKIWKDGHSAFSTDAVKAMTPTERVDAEKLETKAWMKENPVVDFGGNRDLQTHHLNQHLKSKGFAPTVSSSGHSSNSHNNNGQFDIMDLVTGKVGFGVALPALAGFAAPDVERWARKSDKKKEQLNSLEMVAALDEKIKKGSVSRIQDDVLHIFEQFEKDIYHDEFSSPQLAERVKPIADAISKGKITAKALVRLVGEEMVLTHSGKDREFKSEEEIAKAIDLVAVATVSKSNEMSEDKFLGRYEKRSVIEETIRKNLLEFKEGAERDFFISLMPLEILEHSGLTHKDIREARVRAQTHVYENVAAAVIHLATLDEKYLEEHGLTFKEVEYLKAVSKKIMTGDMDALRDLVDNKKDGLSSLVAAGLMAEQSDKIAGNSKVWAGVVNAEPLADRIAKIKAEKEEKHPHKSERDGERGGEEKPHRGHRDEERAEQRDGEHEEKEKSHVTRHKDKQHDGHVDRHKNVSASSRHPDLGL